MIIGNSSIKKYSGFAISTLGYTHKDGKCQDNSSFFASSKMAICCVCDGHGSEPHFRSEIGSKIASNIGIEAIKEFVQSNPKIENTNEKELLSYIKRLKEYIIYKWNEETLKNFNSYPLSVEEMTHLKEEDKAEYQSSLSISNYRRIYGTTFIAGVITSNFWLILQLGDGDAVLLDERGLYMPMPKDENLMFQYTTSLCEKNAIENFRHAYGYSTPIAMILSTDGLKNSFLNETYFLNLYKEILQDAKIEEISSLQKGLEEDLPVLSKKGSGDDISFALAFDKNRLDEYKL